MRAQKALSYVLQGDLADPLAMGASDGQGQPPFKALDTHRKGLSANGTGYLDARFLGLCLHTRTNISLSYQYMSKIIDNY